MPVNVLFEASHPCGLTFAWFIDLEGPHSEGQPFYNFDMMVISGITKRLPELTRASWGMHLRNIRDQLAKRTSRMKQDMQKEEHQFEVIQKLVDDCTQDATI